MMSAFCKVSKDACYFIASLSAGQLIFSLPYSSIIVLILASIFAASGIQGVVKDNWVWAIAVGLIMGWLKCWVG